MRIHRPPILLIVNSKRTVVIMHNMLFQSGGGVKFHLCEIDVYENDGQFVRSFRKGLLGSVTDLALASDDRVIVLDEDCYVHMFSEHGDHLSKFKLSHDRSSRISRIAFHHSSEHVVVTEIEGGYVYLHIYTKDGELVRSSKTHVNGIGLSRKRVILTAEGHAALLCAKEGRVFILY